MATLKTIREALSQHSPGRVETQGESIRRASVAVILAGAPDDLHACFIQRSENPGDRWSGQMAFPGGHHDPGDEDLVATAKRETLEEVGLSLERAELLGELSEVPISPQRPKETGVLSSYVFYGCGEEPELTLNYEVVAAYWIPLEHLWSPDNRTTIAWEEAGGFRFPGIGYEGQVIWGLTYRVLQWFAEALGEKL